MKSPDPCPIPLHRSPLRSRWLASAVLLAGLAVSPAWAATSSFTDQVSFLGAAGTVATTNFDAIAVNTTYGAGTGPAGFTLSLTGGSFAAGLSPMVANTYGTTSGSNYLGLDSTASLNSDTQFASGDALTFSFAGSKAFGLFVVGGADLGAGDIQLSFGGTDFLNAGLATDLGGGSFAYFVGLVSDAVGTSATVTGLGSFALFALDDVSIGSGTTVIDTGGGGNRVPEPASLALVGLALLAACVARRRAVATD